MQPLQLGSRDYRACPNLVLQIQPLSLSNSQLSQHRMENTDFRFCCAPRLC